MTETHQRTALVTGGSRGIGRAIALRLARDGFAVAVNYAGRSDSAEETVAAIRAEAGTAVAFRADIGDHRDVERLIEEVVAAFGGLDVLVNNAGVIAKGPIADMDRATFDRIMRINVGGVFALMAAAAPRLRPGGRVVNLSSSTVGMALPAYGPYAASKAAVEMLTCTFAKELRGRAITVNAVAPGPTATELYFQDIAPEQVEQHRLLPPLERLGEPDDIAAVVSFLAGPDGGWVNGQVVRTNGGFI